MNVLYGEVDEKGSVREVCGGQVDGGANGLEKVVEK